MIGPLAIMCDDVGETKVLPVLVQGILPTPLWVSTFR